MIDRQVTRLVVILDPGLKTKLVQLAEHNDRTLSHEVRRLLKAAVAGQAEPGRQLEGAQHDTEA